MSEPVDVDDLKEQLRRMGKGLREIMDLLHPEMKPLADPPNVRISYPGLDAWLEDQPAPQRTNLRAAVQRYQIAQTNYRNDTLAQIGDIQKRETGKAVLAEIKSAKTVKLTIRPFRPEKDDEHNATSAGRSLKKSTPLGFKVRDTRGVPIPSLGEGTGEGSLTDIAFTPGMWGPKGTSGITGPGSLPDEVLLHELVHACRQMKGVEHSAAVSGGYGNEEEFAAIVIANIYLSEKKQTVFRATHQMLDRKIAKYVVGQKFDVLPSPEKFLDNPQGISPPPVQLLEKIRNRQREMWNTIRDIGVAKAAFNPARDWEAKRMKVYIDI